MFSGAILNYDRTKIPGTQENIPATETFSREIEHHHLLMEIFSGHPPVSLSPAKADNRVRKLVF